MENRESILKNILIFLPLLIPYLIYVFAFTVEPRGDEARYIGYATNLSQGYYSPLDDINLWNGPGYPIVLLPFVLLKLPWITANLLNPLLQFMAVLYFYYTLRLYMQRRPALLFSFLFSIYPPFLRYMNVLMTENISIFLMCGLSYHFCKLHQSESKYSSHLIIASLYFGFLALTKIIFGYVIVTSLFLLLSSYIWKKRNSFKKSVIVCVLALVCCTPYLYYTYSLTGKVFFWGNSAGLGLYPMTSPYQNELGDWLGSEILRKDPQVIKNHGEFFTKLDALSHLERDKEFRKKAIDNIIHYPVEYFKNWLANVGRLLLNYPYSKYDIFPERQLLNLLFYMIPNMFLIVTGVLCIYVTYIRRILVPHEIYSLLLLNITAFGGISLVSASGRYFIPLVPIFLLWLFFILGRFVKVEIR